MKRLLAFLLLAAWPLHSQTPTASSATRGTNTFAGPQTAPVWLVDSSNQVLRSGSNTLTSADNGKAIYLQTSGSTQTLPAGLPGGFRCSLYNTSAGDITLALASVSVNGSSSSITLASKSRLDLTPTVHDGGGAVTSFRAVTSREPLSPSTIWGRSSSGGASEKTVTDFGFSLFAAADAAAWRTTLGGTTVGQNLFTGPNPSAVTWPRINADNSVTYRNAANMRSDLGGTTVGQSLFTTADPSAVTWPRINADNSVTYRSASQTLGDLGGVALSGGNTINGAQTITGQVELTGQAGMNATSAATCGMFANLPAWLQTGDKWARGVWGAPWQFPLGGTVNSSYYKLSLGPLYSSAVATGGGTAAGTIGGSSDNPGAVYLTSIHTGSANTGGVGMWFGTSCQTPANAIFGPAPCAKKTQVARVLLPTSANRAGRIYALTGGYIFGGAAEISAGQVSLQINGSSNVLEAKVCTAYPSTYAAAQTTTGALASPASGTFTAWSVSDSTRDFLIRRTHSGTSLTVEIAPYHATSPTWVTVLSMTIGNSDLSGGWGDQFGGAPFGLYVQPDGTATGGAATSLNSLAIKEVWEATR